MRFGLLVITIAGRNSLPQFFIKLQPFKNIKGVFHLYPAFMKLTEHRHTCFYILRVSGITASCIFDKFCQFVTIFRIDISNRITDTKRFDYLINFIFLLSVNQHFCSLTRNPHDKPFASALEHKRTICHAFF